MGCNGLVGGWRRALYDLPALSASRARRVRKDRLVGTASRARWGSQVQQVLSAPPERMETRWEQLLALQGHSGKEPGNVPRGHHADLLLPPHWVGCAAGHSTRIFYGTSHPARWAASDPGSSRQPVPRVLCQPSRLLKSRYPPPKPVAGGLPAGAWPFQINYLSPLSH